MERTEEIYKKIISSLLVEKLENLKEKYDMGDLGGSGLDKTTFFELMTEIVPSISEEESNLLFKKFDDNKDESISFEEFNKYICEVAGLPFRLTQHTLFDNFMWFLE